MESLGYDATPPCYRYDVDKKLKLVPGPAQLKWASKKDQDKDLLDNACGVRAQNTDTP